MFQFDLSCSDIHLIDTTMLQTIPLKPNIDRAVVCEEEQASVTIWVYKR